VALCRSEFCGTSRLLAHLLFVVVDMICQNFCDRLAALRRFLSDL
jgi:hypothetical protein